MTRRKSGVEAPSPWEKGESLAVGADEITVGPSYPSLDEILPAAFAQLKIPAQITGATSRGWSRMKVLQACPYLYAVTYKGIVPADQIVRDRRPAAEIGILFHAVHAVWVSRKQNRRWGDRLIQVVTELGADPEVTEEVDRLWNAYLDYYAQDYLRPLAAEYDGVDEDGNTCRFDAIVAVDQDQALVPAGTYIQEIKTRSRMDASSTLWANDGEVLGQINAALTDAKFSEKFGDLAGVIIDVIVRQKPTKKEPDRGPKFARFVVPVEDRHRQHMTDLKVWRAHEALYEATGYWPRARNSCIGQYGPCELYQTCADPGTGETSSVPDDNEEEPSDG